MKDTILHFIDVGSVLLFGLGAIVLFFVGVANLFSEPTIATAGFLGSYVAFRFAEVK